MVLGILRPLYLLLATAVVSFTSIAGLAVYYELRYRDRVLPGVRLQGTDLSGMTPEEVFDIAQVKAQYFRLPAITLRALDQQITLRPADLGIALDPAATTQAVLSVGRQGDPITQIRQRAQIWWSGQDLSPVVRVDTEALARALSEIAARTNRPVKDAQIVFDGNAAKELPAQVGRLLDQQQAQQLILALATTNRPVEINLPYQSIAPQVTSVAEAVATYNRLTSSDLIVMVPRWDDAGRPMPATEAFRVRSADLKEFVLVDYVQGRPQVRLQREKFRELVEPLRKAVEQKAQNARFKFNPISGQLTPIVPSRDARTLNVEATLDAIVAAAQSDNRAVTAVVDVTPAPIPDTATAQELGIVQLITQATTFFKGSSPARLTNVRVAAARFNGLVIPPGGVFSFNEHLGEVTEKEGFQEGLIILGNRTVKGIGGGVCQVSTTAYQAALRAGFPIIERYPHGYRVSYYERGMGPGFDASVFSPYADLKFVNNSPGHLLIETVYDPTRMALTFKFYGTDDGRQVIISPPTITDVVPHGPDIYEPDPDNEVPAGKVKQVEYAVNGATVSFTRQVIRNGEVLINERVVSKYVPWQAVYRYGPGFVPPEGAIVRN
jgi:vancomycin resistance protein YoaR